MTKMLSAAPGRLCLRGWAPPATHYHFNHWVCCCCRFAGVAPANSIRPIHEMPGAASASVRDLTPRGGGYQLRLVGGVQKKSRGMLTPLGGVEKSLRAGILRPDCRWPLVFSMPVHSFIAAKKLERATNWSSCMLCELLVSFNQASSHSMHNDGRGGNHSRRPGDFQNSFALRLSDKFNLNSLYYWW